MRVWLVAVLVVGVVLVKRVGVASHGYSLDPHASELGRYVRSIVFGGLDGIVTTFALCSGGEGAHMSVRVTLVLGTSNLFADAVSMAFGDYLSTRAELSHHQTVWQKSRDEPDGGASRVARGLRGRGLSDEAAQAVVAALSQSPDALAHALRGELDVPALAGEGVRNAAVANGLVTLVSFLVFGSVPLLAYAMSGSGGSHFVRAIVLTGITLFLLGAVESVVTHQDVIWSGLETLLTGLLASAIAYGIGRYVGSGDEKCVVAAAAVKQD